VGDKDYDSDGALQLLSHLHTPRLLM
jgi:hypothetical protein